MLRGLSRAGSKHGRLFSPRVWSGFSTYFTTVPVRLGQATWEWSHVYSNAPTGYVLATKNPQVKRSSKVRLKGLISPAFRSENMSHMFKALFRRACGFRVWVWKSYISCRISGYGCWTLAHSRKFRGTVACGRTELTEAPGWYKNICTRTPGIVSWAHERTFNYSIHSTLSLSLSQRTTVDSFLDLSAAADSSVYR